MGARSGVLHQPLKESPEKAQQAHADRLVVRALRLSCWRRFGTTAAARRVDSAI